MVNNKSVTTKIIEYVRSGKLPSDHKDFFLGKIFSDQCVFCNTSIEDKRDNSSFLTTQSGGYLNVCPSCTQLKIDMNEKFVSRSEQLLNEVVDPQVIKNIHIFITNPDKYIFDLLTTEEKMVYEEKTGEEASHCSFCSSLLDFDDKHCAFPMPIPNNFYGYRKDFGCCTECYGTAIEIDKDAFKFRWQDQCAVCSRRYPITKDEFYARKKQNEELVENVCGNCYEIAWQNDPLNYFISKNCEAYGCPETVILDKTNYKVNQFGARSLYCSKCKHAEVAARIHEKSLITNYLIIVPFNPSFKIVIKELKTDINKDSYVTHFSFIIFKNIENCRDFNSNSLNKHIIWNEVKYYTTYAECINKSFEILEKTIILEANTPLLFKKNTT